MTRTITLELDDLEFDALWAWSDVTDPDPCFEHEDGGHGNFNECLGYAPEFEDALWRAYDKIGAAWKEAARVSETEETSRG